VKRTRERIGKTEALFRNVNEGIREASDRLESDVGDFICECGDSSCTEHIRVPLEEYERVREDGATFAVLRGHSSDGDVIEEHDNYLVVRKAAAGGQVARALDPRGEDAHERRAG